ncbi:MAG: hypothetical protein AAGI06_02500 [Pseudomonadota bacterium]
MSVRSRLDLAKLTGFAASFAVVMSLTTNVALSAGGIMCESKDGKVELSINFARLPIYAPSAATARLGEQRWASVPKFGETELGSSQGMIEQDRFSADFADKDTSKIIISLRVPSLAAGEDDGVPATLTFEDGVARAVLCQFE